MLYHLRNRRRPHSSSGMTAGRRGCWGWAPPPLPPGPQDLPRDYGPDGAAGGLKPEYTAASGPRTFGSGPTTGTRSQTTCYVRRGTGRVDGNGQIRAILFIDWSSHRDWGHRLNRQAQRQIGNILALRFDLLLKRTSGQRPHLRHYPHSVCDILVFFSNREEIVKGNTGSVESQLLYPTAVHCSRPNRFSSARVPELRTTSLKNFQKRRG